MNTTEQQITEATARRNKAVHLLETARHALAESQDTITFVEGNGSDELYTAIAETSALVDKLKNRLAEMKPTGLFE